MCLMVYVGVDRPLPTSPWDPEKGRTYVAELRAADEPVRRHFSRRHVHYVGSHEGCGCGFQYGQYREFETDEGGLAAGRESRRLLAELLASQAERSGVVEVYACWDGDQAAEPDHRDRLRPGDFRDRFFREREFIRVTL